MLRHPRRLSKSQWEKFHANVKHLDEQEVELMYHMIRKYGCYGYDLDALCHDLKSVLYRYSCAILK